MHTIDSMKTAIVNFKTDDATKAKAQAVAKQIGIPLSNLLNAYLYELASTGSVHFTASESMTEKIEKIIEEAEKETAAGGKIAGKKQTVPAIGDTVYITDAEDNTIALIQALPPQVTIVQDLT
jgi:addiction module RelB/DinJ family antitoxin